MNHLRLLLGDKGFISWSNAKNRFAVSLDTHVATLELEEREDGLNPILAFWEEYLPAMALARL